ncbi:MAG: hypothetical protein ACI81V_000071 [Lentimonas sp.]|jgi:hypothetical protein
MDWTVYTQMDPHLLVGLVNTELRNHSDSLDDLCKTHDIDEAGLCAHLNAAGYQFVPEQKKFR